MPGRLERLTGIRRPSYKASLKKGIGGAKDTENACGPVNGVIQEPLAGFSLQQAADTCAFVDMKSHMRNKAAHCRIAAPELRDCMGPCVKLTIAREGNSRMLQSALAVLAPLITLQPQLLLHTLGRLNGGLLRQTLQSE